MATRPLRIAVIGSGPAGVYAAEALARAGEHVGVDVFDRLPTPYGLVRYGVAPDHPKIKSITRTLARVLETPGVRFLGNVHYGNDLTLEELRRFYDAVLFATGSPNDRQLGIAGEQLAGSCPAVDFVSWYSAHPDAPVHFPLEATSVAVIGAGNVALDVARVLAKGAEGLADTDVPDHVLDGLATSAVTDIHVFARRGPAQAKFTLVELREMGALEQADVLVDPDDLQVDAAGAEAMAAKRGVRTMVELFRTWSERAPAGRPRRVYFHFLRRPVELIGTDRVEAVRLERLELDGSAGVTGTGRYETVPAQLVIRSIGYHGAAVAGLPFDPDRGTIPHEDGRVELGVYVAGWIKRGPTGVIGTNKADAVATVASVLSDAPDLPPASEPDPEAILRFLKERSVPYVEWDGWLRLDAHELELGRARGRDRIKVAALQEMLGIVGRPN